MLNDKRCSNCGSALNRISRTKLDRIISRFIPHIRAKCPSCERTFRVKTDFSSEREKSRKRYIDKLKTTIQNTPTAKK